MLSEHVEACKESESPESHAGEDLTGFVGNKSQNDSCKTKRTLGEPRVL
jgi:hypothetical protein